MKGPRSPGKGSVCCANGQPGEGPLGDHSLTWTRDSMGMGGEGGGDSLVAGPAMVAPLKGGGTVV